MANAGIKGLGFHHIALRCADMDKSLSMYQALGMTEVARWGEGKGRVVMLDVGDGGRIELFADGSDAYAEEGKWQHFALHADDIEAAYATALAAGFKPHTPPKVVPLPSMTIHIAFVQGPDNEQLEFFTEI